MKSLSKKRKLQHLDLFSGIGGFSLGLETADLAETVAFCDIDEYCHKVLNKHWPHVPIFSDIKELNYETLRSNGINNIDIITGGYPCQPFSVAGRKKGEEDPRHLWPEYFRLVKELRPTWVIGENVSGHIKLGLDTVLEDLESEGYSTRTFSISASSVGANHKRERVWVMAHSNDARDRTSGHEINRDGKKIIKEWQEQSQFKSGRQSQIMENSRRSLREGTEFERTNANETKEGNANQFERSSGTSKLNVADSQREGLERLSEQSSTFSGKNEGSQFGNESGGAGNVADSDSERLKEQWWPFSTTGKRKEFWEEPQRCSSREISQWWESEPDVGRVAHGIPNRVDRLKSLGNSLVPQIPFMIANCIKQIEELDNL